MNTTKTVTEQDLELVKAQDPAISSEKDAVPVYDKEVPAYEKVETTISYGDACTMLFIDDHIRSVFISEYPEYAIYVAKPGDHVFFGSYQQSADENADKEAIEWTVIAKEKKQITVISTKGIDCKPFNDEYADVPWERSSLRAWLNGEFLDKAFSSDEKMRIPFTTVKPEKSSMVYTDAGKNTLDKAFVLGSTQITVYFVNDDERMAAPTDYAVKMGSYKDILNGNCWYWLRSPGYNPMVTSITYVTDTGEVRLRGDTIERDNNAVRPVIAIDLL